MMHLAVLAALVMSSAGALASQAAVRVLSFNIRYGTANDGAHRWEARRDAVIGTIRDHAPHVLGVQEGLRFQLDELARALPGYRELGVGRDDGRTAGEYSAILVDTARFSVLADGTFWYSDTPTVPGSMHWGNRITRVATWARLLDRATGDTLRAYNTHWDHESQPSRVRSAELLLDRVRDDAGPNDRVLVMGDFNSDEANPAFQRLVGTGDGVGSGAGVGAAARAGERSTPVLRDTFRARHPDATVVGTFNAFIGDSTAGKIDAILAGTNWSVLDAGIDRRRWGALWASDHFAVWAVVR
ncbi:MAG: endonuclease/exonuclease/phosphatase family protein [Gemmatimonadaceae bacterium]